MGFDWVTSRICLVSKSSPWHGKAGQKDPASGREAQRSAMEVGDARDQRRAGCPGLILLGPLITVQPWPSHPPSLGLSFHSLKWVGSAKLVLLKPLSQGL